MAVQRPDEAGVAAVGSAMGVAAIMAPSHQLPEYPLPLPGRDDIFPQPLINWLSRSLSLSASANGCACVR
eukprot:COSAG02_NODE_5005_length_4726_cov_78.139615_4_plen_70_part_00